MSKLISVSIYCEKTNILKNYDWEISNTIYKKEIEQLREVINSMICSDNCDRNQLVKKSQELDKLILIAVKNNLYIKSTLAARGVSNEYDCLTQSP